MALPADMVIENRFDVPPEYAAAWLTDFRPDDAQRWFGGDFTAKVRREGNKIYREEDRPDMGLTNTVITLETPTTWHAVSESRKGGKLVFRGTVREITRAEGKGCVHRAELTFEPQTLMFKLFLPLMKPKVQRDLKAGFDKMKQEMEAQYKAGKPATA